MKTVRDFLYLSKIEITNMKKLLLLLLTIFTTSMYSQDITGEWNGILKIPGKQLTIIFKISKLGEGYSATLDSPDQKVTGVQVTTTTFVSPVLKLSIVGAGIEYEGILGEDKIIRGNFKQGGNTFPMDISKEKVEKTLPKRPQEPAKPYAYNSEDITFENNKEAITLAGTFTYPKKKGTFPVVILISGSGAQNRDEELLGHKPFLVLADYLTKNGIAVLRFDDRGTAQSKGNFSLATTENFATDVEAAINYLKTRKEINKSKIGLIGHSEGGLIAPMIASKSKDVNFIVLLSGSGIRGSELLLLQQELVKKASGISDTDIEQSKTFYKGLFEIITNVKNETEMRTAFENYLKLSLQTMPDSEKGGMSNADFITLMEKQLLSPWMQYFLKYDPAPALEKVTCPILALIGEKDLQVPPKENLEAIKIALEKGGNKKATLKELPTLNHLFQESNTGSPSEYAEIEQTFSPKALEEIKNWINAQVKAK